MSEKNGKKGSGMLPSFPQLLLKTLMTPSSVIFLPVLIVFGAVGSWREAILLLALVIAFLIYSALNGAISDKRFSSIRSAASVEAGSHSIPPVAGPLQLIGRASFAVTLTLLIFSATVLLISLLSDEGGFTDGISSFLSVITVSLCYTGPQTAIFFDRIASSSAAALAFRDGGEKPVYITDENSAGVIAESSGALILSEDLLYDSRREIRSVWFSGKIYGEELLSEDILKKPSENAYLLSLAYFNSESYPVRIKKLAGSLERFAAIAGADSDSLINDIVDLKALNNHPVSGAVTLRLTRMSDLSGSFVLSGIPSSDYSVCTSYRDSDGRILPLNAALKKSLDSFFRKASELALTPFIITSIVNEKGRISDRTVLESAYLSGGWFPEFNADADSALSDFGFQDLLLLPNADRRSVSFAVNSGLVKDRGSVLFAGSADETADDPAVGRGGRVKIVMGSSFRLPDEAGEELIPVGSDLSSDLPSGMPQSRPSVRLLSGNKSPDGSSEAAPRSPRPCAAAIFPADAETDDGGLSSLFDLVSTSSEILLKQLLLAFCLCFSLASVLFSFVIPFAFGSYEKLPGPAAVVSAAFISAAVFNLILNSDRPVLHSSIRGLCGATLPGLFYAGLLSGAALAAVISVSGLLLNTEGVYSSFVFPSLTLSAVGAILASRISAERHFGYQGPGTTPFICLAAILIISLAASLAIPTLLGTAAPDAPELLKAVALSLIPAVSSFLISLGATELLFSRSAAEMRKQRRR